MTTSFPARFRELVAAAPHGLAATDGASSVSRSEFDASTTRLAHRFAALGVEHGSLVSIALPPGIRHLECSMAAWKLGAVPAPISPRLPSAELDALVELADPALVVGIRPAGERAWLPGDADVSDEPATDLLDVVAPSWKAPTSGGSTGRPKLIVASQPATVEAVLPRVDALRIDRDGVFLCTGPLQHNAPYMFSLMALLQGHHVVLMRRFDAAEALRLVARHKATWLYVVPTMMGRMLRLPSEVRAAADLSSLRTVLHVGAPCPPHVKRGWLEWLGPETVVELYSGTESQASCMINGTEWLDHPGSVGRVQRGRMQVCGPDGEVLPPGVIGEVWMRPDGDVPTYRYIGATPRSRDGWESLGDMGHFDDDGYLHLADRASDMILVGGVNVYPAEIEDALAAHPDVLSSAVIGLPDEDLGNVVHAIVQVTDPEHAELDDLRQHLAGRLASHKLPRSWELTTEPLRDDSGKVRRAALRAART